MYKNFTIHKTCTSISYENLKMVLYINFFVENSFLLNERNKKKISKLILYFLSFKYNLQINLVGSKPCVKYIVEVFKQYKILTNQNVKVKDFSIYKISKLISKGDYNVFLLNNKNFNSYIYKKFLLIKDFYNTIYLN